MNFSKKTYLNRIDKTIDFLSKQSSDNVFINNNGLAYLANMLFYEKEKNPKSYEYFKNKIENTFGAEKSEAMFSSLRKYQFTSFYTPHNFVKTHCQTIRNNFTKQKKDPQSILEPSAGNGLYVIELAKRFPGSKIDAIEPDKLTFEILKHNSNPYKNISIYNDTFEEFLLKKLQQAETEHSLKEGEGYMDKINTYDLIVSNIPFSEININKFSFLKEYINLGKQQNQTTNFFMMQLPKLLSNNGECHMITSQSFLNKESNEQQITNILNENELLGAVRFNNNFFAEENTKVVADLITFKKRSTSVTPSEYSEKESSLIAFANIILKDTKENEHVHTINGLFHHYPELVNGTWESAFFHNKPAISIAPGEENAIDFFNQNFGREYSERIKTPAPEQKIITAPKNNTDSE